MKVTSNPRSTPACTVSVRGNKKKTHLNMLSVEETYRNMAYDKLVFSEARFWLSELGQTASIQGHCIYAGEQHTFTPTDRQTAHGNDHAVPTVSGKMSKRPKVRSRL